MVTVKDVARQAGVSMITVSRVVNGSHLVGNETRERVQAAIRELNYVPNLVASNLRSNKSDSIALILPDITNAFWTSIARGVEDEAWAAGYAVFICNSDNDLAKEAGYVDRLMKQRVEGVLMVPTPDHRSLEQLARLRAREVRFVVMHRTLPGIGAHVVRTDGAWAATEMTRLLLQSGHRSIAFVGMPHSNQVSEERLGGFIAAHKEAGVPVDPNLILACDDHRGGGAYRICRALMSQARRPDAMLLGNTRVATSGLEAMRDLGIRIPAEVEVAAFHDFRALDHYAPDLIRAIQPAYQMGRIATQRLLGAGNYDVTDEEDIVLKPEIRLPAYRGPKADRAAEPPLDVTMPSNVHVSNP